MPEHSRATTTARGKFGGTVMINAWGEEKFWNVYGRIFSKLIWLFCEEFERVSRNLDCNTRKWDRGTCCTYGEEKKSVSSVCRKIAKVTIWKIIWISEKQGVKVWSDNNWIKALPNGRLLWSRWQIFKSHKSRQFLKRQITINNRRLHTMQCSHCPPTKRWGRN